MKYKMPVLETERLILKRGTFDDYEKVYEYDFTKLRNIAGEFEFVKYDNIENLKLFANNYDNEENMLNYIVYLKETEEPIGNIVLEGYDEKNKSLEIAYNLHPNYWRKGYMTEAVLKVMDYAYTNLNIENITCGYAEENYKSKGLNKKIGFNYYGEKIEYYPRLNKNIKHIITIMNKEDFYKKHNNIQKTHKK